MGGLYTVTNISSVKNADEFRPERWLEGDTKDMEACFASFGFGSRTCIGKNLALMEINKVSHKICSEAEFKKD
jgi:cytochrome P450